MGLTRRELLQVLAFLGAACPLAGCDALHPRPVAVATMPAGTAAANAGQRLAVTASINVGNSVDHDLNAYQNLKWKLQGPGTIASDDACCVRTEGSSSQGSLIHYNAAGAPGSYALISAASDLDPSKVAYLTVRVNPALALDSTTLPDATLGKTYSSNVKVNGGTGAKHVTLYELPEGLSFNSDSGILSGTPVRSGTYQVRVGVADESNLGGDTLTTTLRVTP